MSWSKRHSIWTVGALASAAIIYWAPSPDAEVVAPESSSKSSNTVSSAVELQRVSSTGQQSRLLRILSRELSDDLSMIFSDNRASLESKSKAFAPPAVVAQVEVAPQAPTLPFKYFGKYVEDGNTQVFLQTLEQDWVVKIGDTIQKTYKLEEINSSVLTFTYLPLNQKQTLDIGAAP